MFAADLPEGRVLRERSQEPSRPDVEGDEAAGRAGQPDPVDYHPGRRQRLLLKEQEPDQ